VHSLTYFYNWSFSHVRTPYALKWDGDMVLTPQSERVLRDLAWQLQDLGTSLTMRRDPVYRCALPGRTVVATAREREGVHPSRERRKELYWMNEDPHQKRNGVAQAAPALIERMTNTTEAMKAAAGETRRKLQEA